VEIHWFDIAEIDEKQQQKAERKIRALSKGKSDLIDARIAGHDGGHGRNGHRSVRITCQVRGAELVATGSAQDMRQALDKALDRLVHEVRKLREKRRTRQLARPVAPPTLGIIESINAEEGYGFILTDAGERVYFHQNALKHGLPFGGLEDAMRVALSVEAGDEGPQASAVYPPPPQVSTP
jgi:ribosomal subunit interface protein